MRRILTIVVFLAVMAGLAFALAGVDYSVVPHTWWPYAADYIELRDTTWFAYTAGVWSDAIRDSCDRVRDEIDDSVLSDWEQFLRDSANVVSLEVWADSQGVIFRHDGSVAATGWFSMGTYGLWCYEDAETVSLSWQNDPQGINIHNGALYVEDMIYSGDSVVAPILVGELHGNAETADSALHADHADQADTAGLALVADYADTAGSTDRLYNTCLDTFVHVTGDEMTGDLTFGNGKAVYHYGVGAGGDTSRTYQDGEGYRVSLMHDGVWYVPMAAYHNEIVFSEDIWEMGGGRYWGTDGTAADSFWIYDDGDTARFDADNPIKIGHGSLIISPNGPVKASGEFSAGSCIADFLAGDTVVVGGDTITSWIDLWSMAFGDSVKTYVNDTLAAYVDTTATLGLWTYIEADGHLTWLTSDVPSASNIGSPSATFGAGATYTICWGQSNTASGDNATVSGGFNNTASTYFATVSGGGENTASGFAATVSGGYGNTASAENATVSGGFNNTASGTNSYAWGQFTKNAGDYSALFAINAETPHDTLTADSTFAVWMPYAEFSGDVSIWGGLYGLDASQADTFHIYDDGDTTRFQSDNPIKVGDASIIVTPGAAGKVYITEIVQKYGDYSGVSTYDSVVYSVDTNYTSTDTTTADHADTVCMDCALYYYDTEPVLVESTNTGGWDCDTIYEADTPPWTPTCGVPWVLVGNFCDGVSSADPPPSDTLFLSVKLYEVEGGCSEPVVYSVAAYWDSTELSFTPVCSGGEDSAWIPCDNDTCITVHYERYTIDLLDDFTARFVTTVIDTAFDGCGGD